MSLHYHLITERWRLSRRERISIIETTIFSRSQSYKNTCVQIKKSPYSAVEYENIMNIEIRQGTNVLDNIKG